MDGEYVFLVCDLYDDVSCAGIIPIMAYDTEEAANAHAQRIEDEHNERHRARFNPRPPFLHPNDPDLVFRPRRYVTWQAWDRVCADDTEPCAVIRVKKGGR